MADIARRPTLDLIATHAPDRWSEAFSAETLDQIIDDGRPVSCIVMAADIRSSTVLMREAIDARAFAASLTRFVSAVAATLRHSRGWFDKFTGDGFLAYWPLPDGVDANTYVREVSDTCDACLQSFRTFVADELRTICRNIPARMGLSLGLDGGPVHLVTVAGDLTVVGPAVVGAVRMVSAAEPYETLLNSVVGTPLFRDKENLQRQLGIHIERLVRPTKEYPAGQEVYRAQFPGPSFKPSV